MTNLNKFDVRGTIENYLYLDSRMKIKSKNFKSLVVNLFMNGCDTKNDVDKAETVIHQERGS